jgi:hypothetical protein
MVHIGLYSVGTHHKNFGWENKTNKNMLCRVSRDDTRQWSLCRVAPGRHSAKNCKIIFAKCRSGDTRQRLLCRVSTIWHSAKRILKIKKSLSSAKSRALGKARVHSKLSVLSFSLSHSLLTLHAASPSTAGRRARHRRPRPPRRRRPAAARAHRARHTTAIARALHRRPHPPRR